MPVKYYKIKMSKIKWEKTTWFYRKGRKYLVIASFIHELRLEIDGRLEGAKNFQGQQQYMDN